MQTIRTPHIATALSLAALAALSACGGGGPGAGDFEAACNAQGNLAPDVCACLDEQAQALTPEAHEFVIATIAQDEEEAQRLRPELDDSQALEAGQFISRGIQECIIDLPTSPPAS